MWLISIKRIKDNYILIVVSYNYHQKLKNSTYVIPLHLLSNRKTSIQSYNVQKTLFYVLNFTPYAQSETYDDRLFWER